MRTVVNLSMLENIDDLLNANIFPITRLYIDCNYLLTRVADVSKYKVPTVSAKISICNYPFRKYWL